MKRMLFSALVLLALIGRSETTLTDVVVNQRWPWSEKVDVDFVLTGDAADVDVSATWDALRADGAADSVVLGTLLDVRPGACRFTWDPSSSA